MLDHLFAVGFTESQNFRSPHSPRRPKVIPKDRQGHGQFLLQRLERLSNQVQQIDRDRIRLGVPMGVGVNIALEIDQPEVLDLGTLEWKREGIEVLSVSNLGGRSIVALHVPDGKLVAFERRVQEYLNRNSASGKPKNATLVNSIADIKKAAFNEFWTDGSAFELEPKKQTWFQVWLRTIGRNSYSTYAKFVELAQLLNIEVEPGYVTFPGRTVVAASATKEALEQAIDLLDMVAEIRVAPAPAQFFLSNLKPFEQAEWIKDLAARVIPANSGESQMSYLTLMDTGVMNAHPVIAPHLDNADMHSAIPGSSVLDNEGHGSEMAGVALYGSVQDALTSTGPIVVPHRLESVKIWPDSGINPPHLYGALMVDAAKAVESAAAERSRTFVMMTTALGQTTGSPSEWSATLDRLSFGSSIPLPSADIPEGQANPRLYVLSSGNIDAAEWNQYPSVNELTTAEDPSQAWNPLTVGAATNLIDLDTNKWPGLTVIAAKGDLAPMSTTSILWANAWPYKPDLVAEGGNGCTDWHGGVTIGPEELRLVTTGHDFLTGPLAETGGTSAATAEVGRVCAQLRARYPHYWPETIRALAVHGARYTDAMRVSLPIQPTKRDKQNLLKRYGHGLVDLERSMNSGNRRATLVLQEKILPFIKSDSGAKLGPMNLHDLPWPQQELEKFADTTINMRITLSYFVEPNPARRGWQSKFRYQSHGLRFAVKGSTETAEEFVQRINRLEREALAVQKNVELSELEQMSDPDLQDWLFGPTVRVRGSLHVDQWRGSAARLAKKSHIAVYPVGGWWKELLEAERVGMTVRYSLIVSLEAEEDLDIDLYSPIKTMIDASISAPISVPGT